MSKIRFRKWFASGLASAMIMTAISVNALAIEHDSPTISVQGQYENLKVLNENDVSVLEVSDAVEVVQYY